MRILRIFSWIALTVAAAIGALFLGARFADGPLGPIPGGPLESGPLVSERVQDWSFATQTDTIEMQLLSDERSRTVWILVHDDRAFIPCSIGAPPGKTWHSSALQDGRALIRIDGKRYPVTLTRVEDPKQLGALAAVEKGKYPPPPGAGGESWYFAVEYR